MWWYKSLNWNIKVVLLSFSRSWDGDNSANRSPIEAEFPGLKGLNDFYWAQKLTMVITRPDPVVLRGIFFFLKKRVWSTSGALFLLLSNLIAFETRNERALSSLFSCSLKTRRRMSGESNFVDLLEHEEIRTCIFVFFWQIFSEPLLSTLGPSMKAQ